MLFVMAGCSEQQSIASYIVEESAKVGQTPMPLLAPAHYQPRLYQMTMQRSPFMPAQYKLRLAQPPTHFELASQLDCEQKDEPQDIVLFKKWSLRATFNGGNQATALIYMPSIGTQTATVGQRLILPSQSGEKLNKEPEDLVDIAAISSQYVTLKHQRIYSPKCIRTQIVTLDLYD